MSTIKEIHAYEIIDSKGYPTIEARLTMDSGLYVVTSVPGASTVSTKEAVDSERPRPQPFFWYGGNSRSVLCKRTYCTQNKRVLR